MAHVLFVCRQNAGCSQLGEALCQLEAADTSEEHTASSAGPTPAAAVYPIVVQAMAEVGVDLRHRHPSALTEASARRADLVVTMGCGDECPCVPGTLYVDWDLPDPAHLGLDEVRALRENIREHVESLCAQLAFTTFTSS